MKPTQLLVDWVEAFGYRVRQIDPRDATRVLEPNQVRELRRIARAGGSSERTTTLLGAPMRYFGAGAYCSLINEIWCREAYRFESACPDPRILDCGANVGLASLYFKKLYPGARITAFEPSPSVFRALSDNVGAFGHHDVELVEAAVWVENGQLTFTAESESTGGRVGESDGQATETVRSVDLADYLDDDIDLLKIDIEGAETAVLEHVATRLGRVKRVFVEYHGTPDNAQSLHRVLAILADAGLRYHVEQGGPSSASPFQSVTVLKGFNALLNIFAERPE